MAVGILLVTHEGVASALSAAARHVLARLPDTLDLFEVAAAADPERALADAAHYARDLDRGDGVLVLSDLYGATPCNVAQRLRERGARVRCVAGLNLPMLLRVLNYVERPLDELAEIAASGGRGGIVPDGAAPPGPGRD